MSVSTEALKIGSGFVGLSALAAAARHVYVEVPQGHVGLRTHSDRATRKRNTLLTRKRAGATYGKVGAGYHATIGLRDYKKISTQDNPAALNNFAIDVGERPHKTQYLVRSEVTWGVIDIPEDKGRRSYFTGSV